MNPMNPESLRKALDYGTEMEEAFGRERVRARRAEAALEELRASLSPVSFAYSPQQLKTREDALAYIGAVFDRIQNALDKATRSEGGSDAK